MHNLLRETARVVFLLIEGECDNHIRNHQGSDSYYNCRHYILLNTYTLFKHVFEIAQARYSHRYFCLFLPLKSDVL